MDLVVDLGRVTVVLAHPERTGWVSVRVGAPPAASPATAADVHRLHDVLVAAHVGRLDGARRALVRPDAVRFHAAGQVGDEWDGQFSLLCEGPAAERTGDGMLVASVSWPEDPPDEPGIAPAH